MTKKCPYCGFENPDTSSFCGKCAQNTLEGYNTKDAKLQRIERRDTIDFDQRKKAAVGFLFTGFIVAMLVIGIVFIKSVDKPRNLRENSTVNTNSRKYVDSNSGRLVKKLTFNSYVYNSGISIESNYGLKYHIFTNKQHYSFGLAYNNEHIQFTDYVNAESIKYECQAGINGDSEAFLLNEKSAIIDGKEYKYDPIWTTLMKPSSIYSATMSDKYLITYSKDKKIAVCKLKKARRELEYIIHRDFRKFSINGMHFDEKNDALYVTDGKEIHRYKINDMKNIDTEIINGTSDESLNRVIFPDKTVWSITKYKNKVLVLTTGKETGIKYIYELDDSLFTKPGSGAKYIRSVE